MNKDSNVEIQALKKDQDEVAQENNQVEAET